MEKTHVVSFWRSVGVQRYGIEHWNELGSTNDRARELLAELPMPVLVTAAHQHRGRGRHGRTWMDIPGTALLMTVGFPAGWIGDSSAPLVLLAAAATTVLDTLAEFASPEQLALKYPNDVWVKPRDAPPGKVGGMLIETDYTGGHVGCVLVGIGINLADLPNVPDSPYPVRSLAEVATTPLPPADHLAERLTEGILERLMYHEHTAVIGAWMSALRIEGRVVLLRPTGQQVRIVGFDADGSLRALSSDGATLLVRDSTSLLYDPFA
ncbi:MAG: hypothetical protein D6747_02310 [Chlorobiota bacterium]|nr:MAG: hypothetical protein D6747_02310 [Chlorobiota bacterium]